MKRFAILLLACLPVPAPAQEMDHSHMDHGAMEAPPQAPPAADPHAGHGQPAANQGTPPPIPTNHAAEAFYSATEMVRSRAAMLRESGGMTFSRLMLDRLEYRTGRGADGYHWEGEGWIGGDIDRFAFKTEGEGAIHDPLERAEVQALYSRAIGPWFNLEAGVRHDIRPGPQRTYAVVGIDGLAPYWFEVGAQAFLSDKGDVHVRLEGSYDQRITQRLILQPAAEVSIAAQDVPELGIGSGVSDIELGLRLRYEFARQFAPYIGFNWERKLGESARFARAEGDGASATRFVMGARFWF
ncbi:copper resistance protein B [Sphingobium chlorophenolicum]|uniref:Copper resistance B n=1 Tax=Sphingobium chlorophenolicum TaxID=46429 RepID=A0A081RBE9_SPHCR|nr:copper resistance protein B [Sphingobium chlorophenolicum]KEQ52522.1 Copper resistance B precursor [Sphingobium chlorophenolicum]